MEDTASHHEPDCSSVGRNVSVGARPALGVGGRWATPVPDEVRTKSGRSPGTPIASRRLLFETTPHWFTFTEARDAAL